MAEGGKKLARIKKELKGKVAEGVSAHDIEVLASKLIKKEGAEASFKMVPGYRWATCVNVNEGLVHGIPKKDTVFKKGDLISVDVGLYFKGFHTDTSFSVGVAPSPSVGNFLRIGEGALKKAISAAKAGGRIYDISQAMEKVILANKLSAVKALVGHGIGRALHEEPRIPCFRLGERNDSPEIVEGMVLAIEVMYAQGESDVVLDSDGWTISMRDGKISALFEETVAVTSRGPLVLTKD